MMGAAATPASSSSAGKFVISDSPGTPQTASATAMAQLQSDVEQLLQQREQLRAQLFDLPLQPAWRRRQLW